jgi:hypothetical protein
VRTTAQQEEPAEQDAPADADQESDHDEEEQQPANIAAITQVVEDIFQQYFGDRPPTRHRRRRRNRRREDTDEDVDETHDERLEQLVSLALVCARNSNTHRFQTAVRKLFREVFNIEQDLEFVSHQSASVDDVERFIEHDGDGPDPENLHFDMNGHYKNGWNQAVIEILLEIFQQKRASAGGRGMWGQLPERSAPYLRRLFREKFRRCKSYWNDALPQVTRAGRLERAEEVGIRLDAKQQVGNTYQRRRRRRSAVCTFFLLQNHMANTATTEVSTTRSSH